MDEITVENNTKTEIAIPEKFSKISEALVEIMSGLDLDVYAPNKTVLRRDQLKEVIDLIGLRNTLRWINGEEITLQHLSGVRGK